MTQSEKALYALVELGLGTKTSKPDFSSVNWIDLFDLSEEQGVYSLCLDAVQSYLEIAKQLQTIQDSQLEYRKFQWFRQAMQQEQIYEQQKETISHLARSYDGQGVKMMVMKGYGLSLNYPVSSHRPCTDIDVYLFGFGAFDDQMIHDRLGIETKQNEDKHSALKVQL